jgi:capsular polysaccharide export protein
MARVPNLPAFLGRRPEFARHLNAGHVAVAGWGVKPSGMWARMLAKRDGVPLQLLEDGFLRSIERTDPPLSLVVDDLGIYYDAAHPSRLETLIGQPLTAQQEQRARSLIKTWRAGRISKYNQARDYAEPLPDRFVLVCDQTLGDASVRCGMAETQSFQRMLDAALSENPDCQVLVKMHPDIVTRHKRGYFDPLALQNNPRIRLIRQACHPVRLIEKAQAVYVVTSQMGFEALIWDKPTRCFGMPFYAGWGLTDDALAAPARRGKATLEQLVHAALVAYPRYVDLETGERCDAERAIDYAAGQRRMRERFAPHVHVLGFSRWKRPILKRFLAGSEIRFVRHASNLPAGSTVALWGSRNVALPEGVKTIRIEDGFLRSVGLGADLTQPLSWVCDDAGIYYDASRSSRLEKILTSAQFDAELLTRAAALRSRILQAGLTKYNADTEGWCRPTKAGRVILVPGQVEQDASIRCGAPAINTNLELLRSVRAAHPGAYIVYKPHPDVVAGLRQAGQTEERARRFCDEIVTSIDMARLLGCIDEVHTITSLTGFEALMRGIPVTCYGQPFYAGWGLTTDMAPIERRGRHLDLDALVAASLILYPTYVSRNTGRFMTPEQAVAELIDWRRSGVAALPLWRRGLRALLRLRRFAMPNATTVESTRDAMPSFVATVWGTPGR